MRHASIKMNPRWPRATATSTINTCFRFPPGASLLALHPIAVVAHTFRVTLIPIAERAAPSAHHLPRVRSLAAFGRRPRCMPHRLDGPSSETHHRIGKAHAEHDESALRQTADLRADVLQNVSILLSFS